jgi:hypothetical protein
VWDSSGFSDGHRMPQGYLLSVRVLRMIALYQLDMIIESFDLLIWASPFRYLLYLSIRFMSMSKTLVKSQYPLAAFQKQLLLDVIFADPMPPNITSFTLDIREKEHHVRLLITTGSNVLPFAGDGPI